MNFIEFKSQKRRLAVTGHRFSNQQALQSKPPSSVKIQQQHSAVWPLTMANESCSWKIKAGQQFQFEILGRRCQGRAIQPLPAQAATHSICV